MARHKRPPPVPLPPDTTQRPVTVPLTPQRDRASPRHRAALTRRQRAAHALVCWLVIIGLNIGRAIAIVAVFVFMFIVTMLGSALDSHSNGKAVKRARKIQTYF